MLTTRVRWDIVITLLVLIAAGGFALAVWLEQREGTRVRPQNLVKAEQFKREFDRDLMPGTSLGVVEQYLSAKPVTFFRSTSMDDKGQTIVRELKIEVVNQHSPMFGCGRWSIGVDAIFVNDRLESTKVSEWSFDCM